MTRVYENIFKKQTMNSFQNGTATRLSVCLSPQIQWNPLEITYGPQVTWQNEPPHAVKRHSVTTIQSIMFTYYSYYIYINIGSLLLVPHVSKLRLFSRIGPNLTYLWVPHGHLPTQEPLSTSLCILAPGTLNHHSG